MTTMPESEPATIPESWAVQRRGDGAVLVRVPSRCSGDVALPDAVFAFRNGDPQFEFWESLLRERETASR